MSDAKKQSVERCKYNHDWIKTGADEPFICKLCGYHPLPESKLYKQAEAVIYLRQILKPGDTVYTTLKHVSRSGMSRNIDLHAIVDNRPVWIAGYVGHAIGSPQSRKNWEKSAGLTVGGCGMDMGFHIVYELSRVLFPQGFDCAGERCVSNDHSNGDRNREPHRHTGDGGYALKHQWL